MCFCSIWMYKFLSSLTSLKEIKCCWRAQKRMFYNHSGGQNKTEICIWNTWECIQSCNSPLRTKPYFFGFHLWLVSHPEAERPQPGKKAFQAHFDLFSIWLTLLWTCLVRLPSILALLFQSMWTTCLPASFPSKRASCFHNSPQRAGERGR